MLHWNAASTSLKSRIYLSLACCKRRLPCFWHTPDAPHFPTSSAPFHRKNSLQEWGVDHDIVGVCIDINICPDYHWYSPITKSVHFDKVWFKRRIKLNNICDFQQHGNLLINRRICLLCNPILVKFPFRYGRRIKMV